MITKNYTIEFLTPCFCAGADQTRAELRPSAIRGQLRWWFRALGGDFKQESEIFGGVHGENASVSTFSVRTLIKTTGPKDWHNSIPDMGNKTYLLGFFCGRTDRLQPNGAIAPGSTAIVSLVFRKPPTPELEKTLRIYFSLGSLGFRSSRAAGAFVSKEHALSTQDWEALSSELRDSGFHVALFPESFQSWPSLIEFAGGFLKKNLRSKEGLNISAGKNGTTPNALGSSMPRQASVLHFRPVRIDGALRLALLEAPHNRILGINAKRTHANRGSIIESAGLNE